MTKPVALAADHGGFELKEAVKRHLEERGIEYRDFGSHTGEAADYPDIAPARLRRRGEGRVQPCAFVLRHRRGHQHRREQGERHSRMLLL